MSLRDDIDGRTVSIAFPLDLAASFLPLMEAELAEHEALFGAPVVFVSEPPPTGPRWIVEHRPQSPANSLEWIADTATLVSTVRDAAGLMSTLNMVHSLVTLDTNHLRDDEADALPAAVSRISHELERGFPGHHIRNLQPQPIQIDEDDEVTWRNLRSAIARLQDAHTTLRQDVAVYNPPYAVSLTADNATVLRVPEWSQAWRAGVRPGWGLMIDDIDGWLSNTGAPPHAHAVIAGRRAIALNGVSERAFLAVSPLGEHVSWTEEARSFSSEELLSPSLVVGNDVYLRLRNWISGVGIEERFSDVLTSSPRDARLILDLRGNTGGNLVMAQQLRRLFLRERTLLGTIAFIRGDGTLAPPVPLWDAPSPQGGWPGDLVVLTDALTYSASEDFLHGLQGLPHVTVVGQRSGGGSGRPRTLPVIPGWSVSVSTALTFDRTGRCIEGQGIPVDIEADPYRHTWQELAAMTGRATVR